MPDQALVDTVLARADADMAQSLERLFALLRIPSVSTEAAHRADCRTAAEWLRTDLGGLGFSVDLVDSPEVEGGHPIVLAHKPQDGAGGAGPHALFYGHYDVQPVDPLDLWDHPPFEPRIETRDDGRQVIRARGASDDKGQVMTFVEALRAWTAVAGAPPIPVTILLEGEEEAGGRSLTAFLKRSADDAARARLNAAEIALVCDTGMWGDERPALDMSLRGMVNGTVSIRAANRDLHSGHYGSAARNPIALLVKILADLRDERGGVTLRGFYDGVPETPESLKRAWDALGFDPHAFLGEIDLSVPAGEVDRSVLEQRWARPTAEINGIWGGYTGDGFKTVIPSEAHAKVSFRLVGDQDPEAVWRSFESHVRHRLPHDCVATFKTGHGARAVSLPSDSPAVAAAGRALKAEWGQDPALVGGGGSIPVVEEFKRLLGVDSLLIGFAKDNDNIHSPNEKYDLESFQKGVRSWVRVLAELAAR